MTVSPEKRLEILDALRRGTVPKNGVEALAEFSGSAARHLSRDAYHMAGSADRRQS